MLGAVFLKMRLLKHFSPVRPFASVGCTLFYSVLHFAGYDGFVKILISRDSNKESRVGISS